MKETGKVARGWLGVAPVELTPALAKKLDVKELKGAVVQDLVVDGPAQKAGFEIGDVVIEWNRQPIDSPTTLSRLVAQTAIGSTVEAIVLRDGERKELEVTVEERPEALNR